MGRSVAEATNACRMRRTRGERGCFFVVAVLWVVVAGFFGGVAGFVGNFGG